MEIGKVVVSKSGGFNMTISQISEDGNIATCQWFDFNNSLNEGEFDIRSLVISDEIEKKELEPFEAEIKYKSKGKTPSGDPFSTVKVARGYYEYLERGGVDSIAFVLFNNNKKEFALIHESKPPRDEIEGKEVRMTTAFGGSIDMGADTTYQEICQTEVREEAGYIVPLEKIHFVGDTLVSTQMSQMCHLYLVDVTDIEKTEVAEHEKKLTEEQSEKDANEFSKNRVEWMSIDELMENGDWKSVYITMQSIFKGVITK